MTAFSSDCSTRCLGSRCMRAHFECSVRFPRSTCLYLVGVVAHRQDHSVHLPDHGRTANFALVRCRTRSLGPDALVLANTGASSDDVTAMPCPDRARRKAMSARARLHSWPHGWPRVEGVSFSGLSDPKVYSKFWQLRLPDPNYSGPALDVVPEDCPTRASWRRRWCGPRCPTRVVFSVAALI